MSETEKEALRKLIMIISDLRAKDEERYAAHVNFMNETIKMIIVIESQMNKRWSTVLESLKSLNNSINASLDTLLTGINPKGLKETSEALKEIMDTMNKSVQSMNLEKVLSDLKVIQAGTYAVVAPTQIAEQSKLQQISADTGLKPPSLIPPGSTSSEAVEWEDPHEKAKKKKDEDDEPHLLKPSDFFG